jgi:Cu-Zn family superoxide dismutase
MFRVLAPIAAAVLLCACASAPSGPSASAQLQPTRGNTTSGEVKFTQQGNKVLVTGKCAVSNPMENMAFMCMTRATAPAVTA